MLRLDYSDGKRGWLKPDHLGRVAALPVVMGIRRCFEVLRFDICAVRWEVEAANIVINPREIATFYWRAMGLRHIWWQRECFGDHRNVIETVKIIIDESS